MTNAIAFHERALVGMVLVDPSVLDRCEIYLGGYAWLDTVCSRLWPVLSEMRRLGEPIADIRIVAGRVGNRLDDIGGVAAIGRLASDAGFANQDVYHLGRLTGAMESSRLRRLAQELLRRLDSSDDTTDVISWASHELNSSPRSISKTKSAAEHMRAVIALSRSEQPATTIQTGLADLDRCIGGFRSGQLIVIAARPSIGKSALASQIAIDAAKSGHATLFVSLEMTAAETVARALSFESGLDTRAILDGRLVDQELRQADAVAHSYTSIPLLIEDRRGLNIDRLAALIRAETARRRLGLVVIDYLGLIVGDRRKQRWESITEISNSLKTLAQTESIPILALSQLNRESEGEIPRLSHLRDSGSIEQDADIVMLLHREKRSSHSAELFVAKNRNGPTGKITLEYDASRFRFQTFVGDFANDFR